MKKGEHIVCLYINLLILIMCVISILIIIWCKYYSNEKEINIQVGKIQYANSATVNGTKYINKNDTVILNLKGTDINYLSNSLTVNSIIVKVGGTVVTPTTKTLSKPTNITSGIQYKLTLSGITGNGELSIEIVANTLKDKTNQQNILTTYRSGIIVDNTEPSVVTPSFTNIGLNNVTIKTTVNDGGIGVSKIEWYYKKTGESSYKSKTTTYTATTGSQVKTLNITDLTSATTYNIYVIVYDVLGNSKQSSIGMYKH